MQITLNADAPAETRLIAAFLNDLADLQEIKQEATNAARSQVSVAPTQADATEAIAQPRKSRGKKTEPVTEPAPTADAATETTTISAPAAPDPAPGNASATGAEPAAESGSSENAEPAAKDYSTDELKVLFGKLAGVGRRDRAVKIVRSYGFNGISEIAADKLNDIGAELDALLAEPEDA